jgi:hypothetical protein
MAACCWRRRTRRPRMYRSCKDCRRRTDYSRCIHGSPRLRSLRTARHCRYRRANMCDRRRTDCCYLCDGNLTLDHTSRRYKGCHRHSLAGLPPRKHPQHRYLRSCRRSRRCTDRSYLSACSPWMNRRSHPCSHCHRRSSGPRHQRKCHPRKCRERCRHFRHRKDSCCSYFDNHWPGRKSHRCRRFHRRN